MEFGDIILSKKAWEIGTLDFDASLNRICCSLVAVKFLVLLLTDLFRGIFDFFEFSDGTDFLDLDLDNDLDKDFYADLAYTCYTTSL